MQKNVLNTLIDKLDSLPQDLFSIKSLYLISLPELSKNDPESAVVRLGRAGERLAIKVMHINERIKKSEVLSDERKKYWDRKYEVN
jgi:hypothetical protein